MGLRKIVIPLFTALIFIQIHPSPLSSAPKFQFSIIYTNDVLGEVEPCG
jgi:hypothetical protein